MSSACKCYFLHFSKFWNFLVFPLDVFRYPVYSYLRPQSQQELSQSSYVIAFLLWFQGLYIWTTFQILLLRHFWLQGFSHRSIYKFSFLSLTVMPGLFALIFLSVCMLQSHKIIILSVFVTASGWYS